MFQKQSLLISLLLIICSIFCISCTTSLLPNKAQNTEQTTVDYEALFTNAEKNLNIQTPTARTEKDPLVMVHYMPWFQAPPVSDGYGFHWHQGGAKFDPYEILDNGCANIASHYYPLTGPYDTRDENLLEYQVALMKVAGIDGVIFDWYGIESALDYVEIQESTIEMIKVLKKANLKYIICYEDQSIGKMIEAGLFTKNDSLDYGKKVFSWMDDNFFNDESYVKYENRPVVMTFGPQFFKDKAQWDSIFAECNTRPYFISLEGHSDGFVDGQYNWFNMDGKKTIPQVVSQLNNFYNRQFNKPYLVATAYAGFYDIYAQAGGKSYGYLDYCEGRTFNLTLNSALKAYPDIIQIATWNDYGEGTIIEPTIQNGYSELEVLQDLQKRYDEGFSFSRQDLRGPLALYKLLIQENAEGITLDKQNAARLAMDAIFSGDASAYRTAIRTGKITVDFSVDPILQTPTNSQNDTEKLSIYDANGRNNLALGKPVVANNKIYDFVGSKAVDGDVNTYWEGAAEKYPNTVQIDLVSSNELDIAVLKLNPQKIWGKRTQIIEVLISDDGNNFTTLYPAAEYLFNPIENSNTVVIQLNCKARYIRFDFTKNTGGSAGQLAELEIYGK